jgi:hypothetical protein
MSESFYITPLWRWSLYMDSGDDEGGDEYLKMKTHKGLLAWKEEDYGIWNKKRSPANFSTSGINLFYWWSNLRTPIHAVWSFMQSAHAALCTGKGYRSSLRNRHLHCILLTASGMVASAFVKILTYHGKLSTLL